ncbi:MAG: hypothetical protein IKD31_02700 [Clostridia bacterium]|nr:hypothetical protein [Clostridia bacterium]
MKKIISLVLILATVLGMLSFAGCRDTAGGKEQTETEGLLNSQQELPGFGEPPVTLELAYNPILEGGSFDLPAFSETNYNFIIKTCQIYGDYLIYRDMERKNDEVVYRDLSDPSGEAIPLCYRSYSRYYGRSFWDLAPVYGFLIDPVLSKENSGVPVIHFVSRKMTSHLFTFNVKTQEMKAIYEGEEEEQIDYLAIASDRIYFVVVDRNNTAHKILHSIKNDGSDHKELDLLSETPLNVRLLHVGPERLYYLKGMIVYSCASDFSDVREEILLESPKAPMIFEGYLYYFKEIAAETFQKKAYEILRSPLSDLSAGETVLKDVFVPEMKAEMGRVIFYKSSDLIPLEHQSGYTHRALYMLDLRDGSETLLYENTDVLGLDFPPIYSHSEDWLILKMVGKDQKPVYRLISLKKEAGAAPTGAKSNPF